MLNIIILSLLNGLIFASYCYIVGYFLLNKKQINIKRTLLVLIPFLIMYSWILCLLESIYSIFFSVLCTFLFVKIIFKENIFMSLFISQIIHVTKIINKIVILIILNNKDFMLTNTYKTLDWNALCINLFAIIISTLIIIIYRKQLRNMVKYLSSLKNRKLVLLITIYLNFILIFLYQPPHGCCTLQTITDLIMIFTMTAIVILNISSEMKMESLNRHYQEIFEYSRANGELLAHYKMRVHEDKNRLLMIKGMLDGPKKDIKKYIDTLLKELEDNKNDNNYWLSELRYIPLPGVRNFINYKLIKLKALKAEIEVFVSSELEAINATTLNERDYNDLSTILGVVMDNMIESISVSEEKLVSINIFIEDNKIKADFVNSFSGKIDMSRLNEIGYTTKGEQHGVGLPLVAKIIRNNKHFECQPEIMDKFFIQHLAINLFDKNNLQKISKK